MPIVPGVSTYLPTSLCHQSLKRLPKPFHHKGFTLVELIITILVLGGLTIVFMQNWAGGITAASAAADAEQEAINHRLGSVLLDYAANAAINPTGDLPVPYTSGNIRYAISDGSNANLQALLVQARIRPALANGDGTPADNVRVYQTVVGQTLTVPLWNTFGPAITLTYSEAVIFSTHCQRSATCNSVGTGGIPGNSGIFSASNLSTYNLTGDDYGLERLSTLAIQKQKLQQTADNIDAIRTRLQELFRERQRTASANDTTNFFPRQLVVVSTAAMGNTADCHNDGWYRLDNSDILTQLSLPNSINGLTAWGGQIHYCPDYDATGVKAADAPPHFAALKILTSPSAGGNPPAGSNAGSTIIPF